MELGGQTNPLGFTCHEKPDAIVALGIPGGGVSTFTSSLVADIEYSLGDSNQVVNHEKKEESFVRGDSVGAETTVPKLYLSDGVAFIDTPGVSSTGDTYRDSGITVYPDALPLNCELKSVNTICLVIVAPSGVLFESRTTSLIRLLGAVGGYVNAEHRSSVAKESVALVITKKDHYPKATFEGYLNKLKKVRTDLREHKENNETQSCALDMLEGILDIEDAPSVYISDITQRNSIQGIKKELLQMKKFSARYLDFGFGQSVVDDMKKLAKQYLDDSQAKVDLGVECKKAEEVVYQLGNGIRTLIKERKGLKHQTTSINEKSSELKSEIKTLKEQISCINEKTLPKIQNRIDHINSLKEMKFLKPLSFEHKGKEVDVETITCTVKNRSGTHSITKKLSKNITASEILKVESEYPVFVECEETENLKVKETRVKNGCNIYLVLEYQLGKDSKYSARLMIAEKHTPDRIKEMEKAKQESEKALQEVRTLSEKLKKKQEEQKSLFSKRQKILSDLKSRTLVMRKLSNERVAKRKLFQDALERINCLTGKMEENIRDYSNVYWFATNLHLNSEVIKKFSHLFWSEVIGFRMKHAKERRQKLNNLNLPQIGIPGVKIMDTIREPRSSENPTAVYLGQLGENNVAVKVIPKAKSISVCYFLEYETILENEQNFADPESNIDHEHLVTIIDTYEDENNFYLIMEYCKKNYLQWLEDVWPNSMEPNPETKVHLYFKQLLEALQYLHAMGIVHGDVKSANILAPPESAPESGIKLCDFGCSGTQETKSQNPDVGTPFYKAPEVPSRTTSGSKSDIWSAGVVYLESLVPHVSRLFSEHSPSSIENLQSEIEKFKEKEIDQTSKKILLSIFVPYGQRPTASDLLQSYVFTSTGVKPRKMSSCSSNESDVESESLSDSI